MPASSREPWNWAVKIPAPELAPKMHKLKTNMSWFTMDTPLMGSVPMRPTMMLSRRETKLEMPF